MISLYTVVSRDAPLSLLEKETYSSGYISFRRFTCNKGNDNFKIEYFENKIKSASHQINQISRKAKIKQRYSWIGLCHLTIILPNRAEYRLILYSQRSRRPSRPKSEDIPTD